MNANGKKRYAELLVDTALALQPKQYLYIEANVEAEEFVALVAETALERGAADVVVRWMSTTVDRLRLANKTCTLDGVLAEQAEADWMIENGGALLRLESPNISAFEGLDAGRVQQRSAKEFALHRGFRTRGTMQNVIACVATPSWARCVFPDLPVEEALNKLWTCILGSVMADGEDPGAAWHAVIKNTFRRRGVLDEKQYTALHIKGNKTDLYMELPVQHKWDGGGVTNPQGIFFLPNMPSYEIFTSPKADSVRGNVAATMPLNFGGGIIRDLELKFEGGKVTEFHASHGQELLESLLHSCENSDRLGEVAIVEHGSPVQKQGIIFYTTVCDENAACHLALGNGFCPGGAEAAREKGINSSSIHVDFMIGAADTCIFGRTADGAWENIMVDGVWAF